MSKYSGLLKAKLQELLTARGLPIDGTKEVLIERLEESDKIGAELDEDEDDLSTTTNATNATVVTADEPIPSSAPVVDINETAVSETVQTPLEPVEKQVEEVTTVVKDDSEISPTSVEEAKEEEVTPETLKAAAVDYLTKKIARAQKFSEDAQVATLQADLKRIEKFGIALDSAIARELGYAPKKSVEKKSVHKKPVHKHNHNQNRHNRGGPKFRGNGRRNSSNYGHGNYHSNDRYASSGRVYKPRY
ncbi:hypothetical protein C6P42_002467 [Pichia californica]|nr:hypothetical protein C6P42_002467 [[Candida] californica]